jgi:spore coat polysaccharide biosynthesis predicted glycosyltransferase SpsG
MSKSSTKLSIDNYKRFCELEGSEYIASEYALTTILKFVRTFNISTILEIGLGIGSISDTIFKYAKIINRDISYTGTENNEFCLKVLPSYVEDFDKINLYSEINEIKEKTFDFIIIDGLDDSLAKIEEYVKTNTILFVEGDRSIQTKTLRKIFPKHVFVNSVTLKKNPEYVHGGLNKENYIGGGQLIFINPTLKMRLYFIKEKIKTYIIFRVRRSRRK